jgi:hypothetical protein
MSETTPIIVKEFDEKIIESLYNNLNAMSTSITTANIIELTTKLMQLVESYPLLKGSQKKNIVIFVLKKFVTSKVDVESQQQVLSFIDLFLPSVIDTLISLDNSEIEIKVKKCCGSFFSK